MFYIHPAPTHLVAVYLQGYRYELWCIARSVGCKYCMVHVDSAVEQVSEFNVLIDLLCYSANMQIPAS